MGDQIIWKEANSRRGEDNGDDHESDEAISCDEDAPASRGESDQDQVSEGSQEVASSPQDMNPDAIDAQHADVPPTHVQSIRGFSHHQINLSLRRNITKLADRAQHEPKPNYVVGGQSLQSFDQWIEGALVAISPSADIILFSGQSPEKIVFVAKLRMDPLNQYTTKALDIPLDYDEQITSLLCLPIMSTQRTSLGLVDWTALVVGLSSGYVKFYTEQSICLLSLKFCDEPVVSIKIQTQKVNTNARSQTHFASIVDELFIAHRNCAIVIDGIGLYENLRISKADVVKNKLNYEPAYNTTNLPTILTCQRWKFEESRDSRVLDADLLGMRCTTRFDALKLNSIDHDHVPSKSCTRTLVLVGRNPFLSCYSEAKETVSHSYTELIGSLLPFWSKPQQSRVQINDISSSSSLSMFDKGRLASSIVPSPDKRLAALTDDFGRVLLIDVTNWLVVRIWKGYRNAQCGWVEVKRNPEKAGTPHASFLVIYAPKRGLLEVWSSQRGPRVAAFNVGKSCRLLYAGHRMLNMRAEAVNKSKGMSSLTDQSYDHNCYLLNAKSETLFAIELPYTYSLYKYGDLKSRDRLLINELSAAIQHEVEITSMSEIIQRMALAESLHVSIQKLALNLVPDKLVPIMENLINKIMKEYDNHAGETMSNDDQSVVELCKRVILLCSMFNELAKSGASDMSLPEVNERLIEQYEEHPKEVDEFAEQLGWDASEVLRYLSLIALEKSFRKDSTQNPWPNMGEPLAWSEFVGCFDLDRTNYPPNKTRKTSTSSSGAQLANSERVSIKLKTLDNQFLKEDRVIKTSLFMYSKLSERFHRLSANLPELTIKELSDFNKSYNYLEPSSRLILIFQFWLSTKLCNHWKMWAFLQQQVGTISDELRIAAMASDDNDLVTESWKRIYHLMLENDNIYGAMIATAVIRSDTLRMMSDNEKREKLDRPILQAESFAQASALGASSDDQKAIAVDWECLCVDAERMSIFSQQLEDVFLLALLLRYSPRQGKLVDRFVYRVARISPANILRGGPTIISELVAQWVVQTDIKPGVFTQPYGSNEDEDQCTNRSIIDQPSKEARPKLFALKFSFHQDSDEHTKELLHHVKTSFPHSLDSDVLLLNCVWELCNKWTSSQTTQEKAHLLERAYDCLTLLSDASLRHNSASWAYKTFFQRTFERLTILIETNSTILSPKCVRSRDTLARRELNMSESCLDDFVSFCFKLSDFMLDTCRRTMDDEKNETLQSASGSGSGSGGGGGGGGGGEEEKLKLQQRLLAVDDWWSTPSVVKMFNSPLQRSQVATTDMGHPAAGVSRCADESSSANVARGEQNEFMVSGNHGSLVSASLSSTKLFDVDTLIELNRLATLMVLIFKLRIIKTYPLSIIGEESRQMLKLDLQHSPSTGADMKTRSGLLNELRQKFARKCVVSIVAKVTEDTNEFDDDAGIVCSEDSDNQSDLAALGSEDIDTDKSDDVCEKQLPSAGINKANSKRHRVRQRRDKRTTSSSDAAARSTNAQSGRQRLAAAVQTENNESMALFTHLLSLTCEWEIDSDELHLELAFELYRCNHDKLAAQVANRTRDKRTLANGLLKISSQRVLAMFGMSPKLSSVSQWRKRVDKWSLFQPNVASWLKGIQEEEARHEIGQLIFLETVRQARGQPRRRTNNAAEEMDGNDELAPATEEDFDFYMEQSLGLRLHVLPTLCNRTKLVLETVTNYLEGQANRLAYDLLQLLESSALTKFLANEKRHWSRESEKFIAASQSVGE